MKSGTMLLIALLASACGVGGNRDSEEMQQKAAASELGGATKNGREQRMEGMAGMEMRSDSRIRISGRQAAFAGVSFAIARNAPLERTVRAVAMVVPDEGSLGIVNARVSGWVEKLYVNETGRHVRAGEALLDLYAPDLVTAQQELLLAKRLPVMAGRDSLIASARRRLQLWGIAEEDIDVIERSGVVRRTVTIRSAYTGHVLEKRVIEGQMVHAGDRLFKIADLSRVWVEPAIFEQDIPLVRVGQRADFRLDAVPSRGFSGRVTFLYPTLDRATRTLRVRVEVPNPNLEIKPMMYGTVRIHAQGPRGVLVPLTAVLPAGDRDLAFVVRGAGVVPTEVVVGDRGDDTVHILSGLLAGDTVVASATFLFDSESNLSAAMAGIMLDMGMGLDMGGMPMGEMEMGEMQMKGPDAASDQTRPDSAETGVRSGRRR